MLKNNISIIVPCFNEAASIGSVLEKLKNTIHALPMAVEIIVVDDGSSDASLEILKSIQMPKLRIIRHESNKGYGASLKSGITAAKHAWIAITDADGTYPVDRIPDLIKASNHADMVIGARSGEKVHDSLLRMIGRSIVRRFASFVADARIVDINSGLRLFKKSDAIRFWHLFPNGFSFTSTLTVASHTNGNRVIYIPIDYHKRPGRSSIKPLRDFTGFMTLIVSLAIYFRPLRVFVPISIALAIMAILFLIGGWVYLDRILDATFAVFIIASLQTLFFGFIAEMIVRRFYSN